MTNEERNDLHDKLGRIEAQLEHLIGNGKDKEQRLRMLERRDAYVVAFCTFISVLSPWVCRWVFKL